MNSYLIGMANKRYYNYLLCNWWGSYFDLDGSQPERLIQYSTKCKDARAHFKYYRILFFIKQAYLFFRFGA